MPYLKNRGGGWSKMGGVLGSAYQFLGAFWSFLGQNLGAFCQFYAVFRGCVVGIFRRSAGVRGSVSVLPCKFLGRFFGFGFVFVGRLSLYGRKLSGVCPSAFAGVRGVLGFPASLGSVWVGSLSLKFGAFRAFLGAFSVARVGLPISVGVWGSVCLLWVFVGAYLCKYEK